ncbi:hypothetical protein PAL_GLEAN10013931 [Pteropus alecto]|uniref:Uncharacterized protein n=1 Tax=Pteropus alecto TaxID=9402 RepID=L5K7D5_PTEAL|nr:hypothetical protein PAL_GLEAN10013931 [Pteropus alecto]
MLSSMGVRRSQVPPVRLKPELAGARSFPGSPHPRERAPPTRLITIRRGRSNRVPSSIRAPSPLTVMALPGLPVDLRHRSTGLSAAGKDSKRLREAPTPQPAAATQPNLPGSDPLRSGDAGRSAAHPTQPNPAASPHLGERRGGPEPSGLSSEDAKGLGRGRQRGSNAACGALPAPTPLAPPAGPDAGGPAPPPKVRPRLRPGH